LFEPTALKANQGHLHVGVSKLKMERAMESKGRRDLRWLLKTHRLINFWQIWDFAVGVAFSSLNIN
jgi:hypothetical protein